MFTSLKDPVYAARASFPRLAILFLLTSMSPELRDMEFMFDTISEAEPEQESSAARAQGGRPLSRSCYVCLDPFYSP